MSFISLVKKSTVKLNKINNLLKLKNQNFGFQYCSVSTTNLPIVATKNCDEEGFDSIVVVGSSLEESLESKGLSESFKQLNLFKKNDEKFEKELTFAILNNKRVIYSPTGPLDREYDDIRRISDATKKGLKKALKTGSKKPLLVNCVKNKFKYSNYVSLLAALEESYVPLEVREAKNQQNLLKIEKLGYWNENLNEAENMIKIVNGLELGRIVTRDIAGSDPERMSAAKVLDYVNQSLSSSDIKINVIDDPAEFEKNYPCFAAVNRAAQVVPRHRGRIIKLEYNSSNSPIDTTLFLIGKGITYDTGGADIKHGGNMASMHRDKSGAAFVAGFFKMLALLKPQGLKVHGTLCLTRNNVGEEAYVADEIITSRAKKRIRIGNTDAEGRMAIIDSLCEAKEMALKETNPHLFTIATLTGHVLRCYGPNYTGIMSNGPARSLQIDKSLQECGEDFADPYEISRIRREDYEYHKGKSEYEDLVQCAVKPSADSSRGHQGPAAFLLMGSGLDEYGSNSKNKKFPYTHVDIAGSQGKYPGIPTGAPLPSFFSKYVLPRLK